MWRSLCRLRRADRPSFVRSRLYSNLQGNLVPSDAQRHTIYALSTPPGKAGIAVVRVSGPDALLVWKNIVRPYRTTPAQPIPWKMERCRIIQPQNEDEQLDDALAVYFKGPKSFTTEDVVELHLHSGRAIVSSVLKALSQLRFCRPAEAGEFTRRAFQGGRLDLTQVEGLKDLIDAETEGQRRIAMRAATGTVKVQFDELRSGIISCLANIEALLDFGEGEDLDGDVYEQARSCAQDLLATMKMILQDSRRGEIIRSGIRLAIFGPPNAGKSTLLNCLAQREAAIVTSVPGTTRDILELSLDINGLPITILDTAGLRETDNLVEKIGVERARKAVEAADISLCVLSLPEVMDNTLAGPRIAIPSILKPLITSQTLFLLNKTDIAPSALGESFALAGSQTFWKASLNTGKGTAGFLFGLGKTLQERFHQHDNAASAEMPLITRARHRVHLESACQFLQAFLETPAVDVVLGAEELRYAARAIGKISGVIDVEDVLDVVFKDFCIGK